MGSEASAVWGNTLSTVHGAYSMRVVGPMAKSILQDMLADPNLDYLKAPRFAAELHAWAVAEARTRLLSDTSGGWRRVRATTPGLAILRRAPHVAWALLHRCGRGLCRVGTGGLSPAAAARLGRDRTAAESRCGVDYGAASQA